MTIKLGFIAISGVRAYNRELTELGLTLPGFIERNKVIASLPSLGLLTLAGLTNDNSYDIDYIEVPEIDKIDYLPKEYDIVAISSFTAKIKDAYILADRYMKEGTTVILGGLHVTMMPQEAIQHADSIVIGEGEVVWQNLLHDYKNKKLKKIYDARGNEFDFNLSPMPKFSLLNPNEYNRLTIQTQRGCIHSCEFCASSRLLTPKYKVKPVEKIIAEIREIKKIWKEPFIEFADDNTFVDKKHSKKFLKELVKEKIKWFTETDISVAYDDELLALMRDSGCKQILIGFETTNLNQLKNIETKGNWKAKQLDKYFWAINKIQSYGITVNGTFILGLDGQTPQTFDNLFKFVDESSLYEIQVTLQTPFPGTKLYERLKNTARLITEDAWELATLFDINFIPDKMNVKELNTHFTQLVQKLYSKEFTKKRRARFYQLKKRGLGPF